MSHGVRCSRLNIVAEARTSCWKRGCQVSNDSEMKKQCVRRVSGIRLGGNIFCDKIVKIGIFKCWQDSALVSNKEGKVYFIL